MAVQQLSFLYEDLVELIIESLNKNDEQRIRTKLLQHNPAELALMMEALPHDDRSRVWP